MAGISHVLPALMRCMLQIILKLTAARRCVMGGAFSHWALLPLAESCTLGYACTTFGRITLLGIAQAHNRIALQALASQKSPAPKMVLATEKLTNRLT